jgi:8-oxo-dGTP pyrophosphatase MutT (NUDIX family)
MSNLLNDGKLEAVAFVIIDDGRLLLEKRRLDRPRDAGKTVVPAGMVEEYDFSPDSYYLENALKREFNEEFNPEFNDSGIENLSILRSQMIISLDYNTAGKDYLVHYFHVIPSSVPITSYEAAQLLWCPLTYASKITARDSDKKLIGHLLNGLYKFD